jgi:hypothetical protein
LESETVVVVELSWLVVVVDDSESLVVVVVVAVVSVSLVEALLDESDDMVENK